MSGALTIAFCIIAFALGMICCDRVRAFFGAVPDEHATERLKQPTRIHLEDL